MVFSPLLFVALQGPPPPLVYHGDPRAPIAWVAAADAQLWVCWDGPLDPRSEPDPGCWRRLALEVAVADLDPRAPLDAGEVAALRLGFVDPRTLALVDERGRAWSIQRDGLPIVADDLVEEAASGALATALCSARGWLPRRDSDRRWRWHPAPCQRVESCPPRSPSLRRRPTPLDLALTIEARIVDDRGLDVDLRAGARGFAITVGVAVAVDLRGARRSQQEALRLAAKARSVERGLPIARASSALAAHESEALARARCRAWEVIQ